MTRRTGVTLVEVLVAIFVMAIGLIALLTLFPLGVLRMAQAIRHERCAQCAYSADKLAMMNNIRNDPTVTQTGTLDYFANPDPVKLPNADPFGESYPVFVDPIGYKSSLAGGQHWVGSTPGVLRRRPTQYTINNDVGSVLVTRTTFTLLDDIIFESTATNNPLLPGPGTPQKVAGAILRDTRYSWAYLLRRPQTSDRSVVDCSIVVFDQRPLALVAGSLSLEEYVYPNKAYFDATKGTITVNYTNDVPPPLRVGDWILDSTFVLTGKTGSAHAYFYRVVATEELVKGATTCARYEVQNPIRGFDANAKTGPDPIDGTIVYQGTVIVIRGIAEVFEKGPARLP
jgi:type II secretory pathway pseudopilin PulG